MVTWIYSSFRLTELFRTIGCLPSWSIDPPCLLVSWLETTIICAMTVFSYILTHRNYSERSLCFPSWSMYPPSTAHFEPKRNLYWPTVTLWRESGHWPGPLGLGCSSKFWILCYTDWPKINLCAPSLFHTCYERQPLFNFHRIRLSKVSTVAGLPVNSSCTSTQLSCNYLYDPWSGDYRVYPKRELKY